jgi:radical SAM protein with 4Fe4S-binding SPASM domain
MITLLQTTLKVPLGIHCTATKYTYAYFPGLLQLADTLWIRKITTAGLYSWNRELQEIEVDYKEFSEKVGTEESLRAKYPQSEISVMLLNRFEKRKRPHCNQPWTYLFINSAGEVYPCCQQLSAKGNATLGNCTKESLAAIWNGPAMQEFRTAMNRGTSSFCSVCYLR